MSMLALSLTQPMGYGIVHMTKGLENRSWPQLRHGLAGLAKLPMGKVAPGELFAIHASGRKPDPAYIAACERIAGRELPLAASMRSSIIGTARIVDVVSESAPGSGHIGPYARARLVERFGEEQTAEMERWFMGPHALVLDERRPLEHPIGNVNGKLYFWQLADDHERIVRAQLARQAA